MELSYQSQYQQNLRGGLNTHKADKWTGTYDWVFQLDFNRLGVLPEASRDYRAGFYLKAKGSYNESVQEYVGSLCNPNADPAGEDEPVFINKWWLWQKFFHDKIELRLGVLETHKDLVDVSLYANHEDRDFLNRASFRNALIPHTTGMGAFLKVEPVNWFYMQALAVDAQAKQFHTQFDTAFHEEDWYIGNWEAGLTPGWKTRRGPMPGRYRAGFWYNPTVRPVFQRARDAERNPQQRGHDTGMYLGLDQMVWKENTDPADPQGLGVFSRFGAAHGDVNKVSEYWQVGASYRGLLPGRDPDVFGFSMARSRLSEQYREKVNRMAGEETVYEWYYSCFVTPAVIVSPDLQVITNPGGNRNARDAIVGGVRVRLLF